MVIHGDSPLFRLGHFPVRKLLVYQAGYISLAALINQRVLEQTHHLSAFEKIIRNLPRPKSVYIPVPTTPASNTINRLFYRLLIFYFNQQILIDY